MLLRAGHRSGVPHGSRVSSGRFAARPAAAPLGPCGWGGSAALVASIVDVGAVAADHPAGSARARPWLRPGSVTRVRPVQIWSVYFQGLPVPRWVYGLRPAAYFLSAGVRREAGGPASENRPAGHLWARGRGLDAPDRLRRRTRRKSRRHRTDPGLLARAMMHKLWNGRLGQMG